MTEQLTPEEKRLLVAQLLRKKASETSSNNPASYGQRGLWFLHALAPDSSAYHIALSIEIRSPVDASALAAAIQALTDRHQALRTIFVAPHGLPVQKVYEYREATLKQIDASGMDAETLLESVVAAYHQPFDLANGPLIRWELFSQTQDYHVLLITVHHIVADGWSIGILMGELQALYAARVATRGATSLAQVLPPARQYADFVRWQAEYVASAEGERALDYWLKQLAGDLPTLSLPADFPRPPMQTFNGASVEFMLGAAETQSIRTLAQREGTTLFVTLAALFHLVLQRWTGQEQIITGVPTAGRSHGGFEGVFGYLVNPIALRSDFTDNPTLRELIQQMRETVISGLAHQDYPFPQLVERLAIPNDPSRSPVFQAMFNLLQVQHLGEVSNTLANGGEVDFGNLKIRNYAITQEEGQVEISMVIAELQNGLRCTLQYNTDLFAEDTIKRMARHWQAMLQAAPDHLDTPVAAISLLTAVERQQIVVDWNITDTEYPADTGVHILFEQQAARSPRATAAVFGDEHITYGDLNARANRLAHYLRTLGVQTETLVGVHVERGLDMLVTLFGVLKAGAAYVPMDPTFPSERLKYMIEDAAMPVIISQAGLSDQLVEHEATVVHIDSDWPQIQQQPDTNPQQQVTGENLAYVIFTSGSTGRPKGVQVEHHSLTNFLLSMRDRPGLTEQDVMLALTTLSFDIAALELYLPLIVGAQVVLLSREDTWDGRRIAAALEQYAVTVMQATPASWQLLLESGWEGKANLRMLCGGEALPSALAQRLLDSGQALWNMYGPTETTIWSTVEQIVSAETTITIGRPIANTQVFVLDSQLQPVPVGLAGTLYIGGDGVARGYINRPDLTVERFIDNPFGRGRIYNTGDLARWLPDGRLECLGRVDNQVKVRGFRIELGDIEATLESHESVQKAVVIAREDQPGDKRLVGYVVGQPETPFDEMVVRDHVKARLPVYMVPSVLVRLDALPMTPNGKVDRRALPAPQRSELQTERQLVEPRTATDTLLVELWRNLLEVDQISIYDNFFDLGGHSLQIFQLSAQIEEKTGYRIEPAAMRLQTLRQLSASIEVATGIAEQVETPVPHYDAKQPQVKPFFFGPSDEYIYGMYYAPQVQTTHDTAVVICAPWGQEYIRTHRALHQLGLRLSTSGIPVLRFDYYGTGDSAGEDADFNIERSLQDISLAVEQVRQDSGKSNIVLVGWRLGAALAALASSRLQLANRLVLWDPIVNGSTYMAELTEWHRQNLHYYLSNIENNARTQSLEILGFAVSAAMHSQIQLIDLLDMAYAAQINILLIEREAQAATAQLRQALTHQPVQLRYELIDGPLLWTENTDKGLVPHQTLQTIVSWIVEG